MSVPPPRAPGWPAASRWRAPIDWPLPAQYALALTCGLLALGGRIALTPLLGERVPFILLFAALMVLIVLVRPGPFLVAALVGGLSTWFVIVPSRPGFGFRHPLDPVQIWLFVLAVSVAFTAAWLSSRSQRRLRRSLRLAEQQREALRVTLASIADAVITTDAAGQVTFMNPAAQRLTGWRNDEAVGRPLARIFELIAEGSRQPLAMPIEPVMRGAPANPLPPALLVGREGGERPIEESTAPIRDADGDIAGIVLVFRDITERRLAERASREADMRKDEFIATLAHELSNPLAPIASALTALEHAPEDRSLQRRSREIIGRQLRHLVRLVDDLLDMSRITQDRLELRMTEVSLGDVLKQAIETCRPAMQAGGHRLELDLPAGAVLLHGDPVRLSQVFGNLLGNAFKYSEHGGHVTIAAHLHDTDVDVVVSDEGVGFPPQMSDQIFGMFTRVDHMARGGLGIGLTLVRRLVELHGGSVRASSDGLGRGSRSPVTVPVLRRRPAPGPTAAAAGAAQPALQPAPERGPARRVLVVDDNRDACDTMAMLLELLGHEVHKAYDGVQALADAERFRPDLVLLDIGLPRLDGHEVARRLRAAPWGADITLVALTGWGQQEDRQRSAEAGFDDHLTKPVDEQALAVILALPARRSRPTLES